MIRLMYRLAQMYQLAFFAKTVITCYVSDTRDPLQESLRAELQAEADLRLLSGADPYPLRPLVEEWSSIEDHAVIYKSLIIYI